MLSRLILLSVGFTSIAYGQPIGSKPAWHRPMENGYVRALQFDQNDSILTVIRYLPELESSGLPFQSLSWMVNSGGELLSSNRISRDSVFKLLRAGEFTSETQKAILGSIGLKDVWLEDVTQNGEYVVVSSFDRSQYFAYRLADHKLLFESTSYIYLTPDGSAAAVKGGDLIEVNYLSENRQKQSIRLSSKNYSGYITFPRSDLLILNGQDLIVYDVEFGEPIFQQSFSNDWHSFDFKSKTLLVWFGRTFKVYQWNDGQMLERLNTDWEEQIYDAFLSSNGRFLTLVGRGKVEVLQCETGALVFRKSD